MADQGKKRARVKGLVSVIIPTFNRAQILNRAVDSVLAQTYRPLELIVVDDGSEDRTPEVLAAYGNQIQVLTQANQGVSSARNAGIRQSSGEFVALLDSDDAWTPDKLAVQAAFFADNPQALICQTEEIWIRNGRRVNPRVKHKKPSGMIFIPSLSLCLVSPSAVMMRYEIFEMRGLFDESFPVCEDYDLWLRICRDIPVFLVDRPCTVKYGGHEDQLSASHSQDRYRILSMAKLLDQGDLTPEQRAAALAVVAQKSQVYANGCLKRGKTSEAEAVIQLSARLGQGD